MRNEVMVLELLARASSAFHGAPDSRTLAYTLDLASHSSSTPTVTQWSCRTSIELAVGRIVQVDGKPDLLDCAMASARQRNWGSERKVDAFVGRKAWVGVLES